MKNENPAARFENIIVHELPDEVLICDTSNNRMFCLNQTAAEVWKLADGTRNIKEISRLLSKRFKSSVSEELVYFALQELSRENLLTKKAPLNAGFQYLSRREVIRRVGLASMIALPLISSLSMPKAVHAASNCMMTDFIGRVPDGCFCDDPNQCISLCCNTADSICVPNEVCNSPGCGSNDDCPSFAPVCDPSRRVCCTDSTFDFCPEGPPELL